MEMLIEQGKRMQDDYQLRSEALLESARTIVTEKLEEMEEVNG